MPNSINFRRSLFILLILAVSGCLTSTNPFYKAEQVIKDDLLIGTYVDKRAGHMWTIKSNENDRNCYIATLRQGEAWSNYTLTLFRIGDVTYLDLFPEDDSSLARDPGGPPTMSQIMKSLTAQPLHFVVLVDISKDGLSVSSSTREGLRNLFKQRPDLRRYRRGDSLLLPGPVEENQNLLRQIGEAPKFLDYKADIKKNRTGV
jgi:hypothetical protein